jgi:uncharacterized protein YqeY
MIIRETITQAYTTSLKAGDKAQTATIRLIQSAIKNRDIELRVSKNQGDDNVNITEVLQKMVKQRRESILAYEAGNRPELAAKELLLSSFCQNSYLKKTQKLLF